MVVTLLVSLGTIVFGLTWSYFHPRRCPHSQSRMLRYRRNSSLLLHGRNTSGGSVTGDTNAEELESREINATERCVEETAIFQPNVNSEAALLSQSANELMAHFQWNGNHLKYLDDDDNIMEVDNIIPTATDNIGASTNIPGRNVENDMYSTNNIYNINHEASAFGNMTSSLTASMMTERTLEDTSSAMSMPASEFPLSDTLSPASSSDSSVTGVENVGQRVNIIEYALGEWVCYSRNAEQILRGYAEIQSLLGFQYLRRIRGDNYSSIIRAAIFQTLSHEIPIPSGGKTFEYLSQAIKKCEWIQNWKFSSLLPYHDNNVIRVMEVSLQNLDSVVFTMLCSTGNQEDKLAALLNSDPYMDLLMVEAVKLQMLQQTMQLHEMLLSGEEVPFFALLMFARDTSKTPKDFMNYHLNGVGNTGSLGQLEICLLGYTLGVTIHVIRPIAHGTEEFNSSYPNNNQGNLPQIFLIEEDDQHYNVLVE